MYIYIYNRTLPSWSGGSISYPYPTMVLMASLRLSLLDFLVRSSSKAYGTKRGLRLLFKSWHNNRTIQFMTYSFSFQSLLDKKTRKIRKTNKLSKNVSSAVLPAGYHRSILVLFCLWPKRCVRFQPVYQLEPLDPQSVSRQRVLVAQACIR